MSGRGTTWIDLIGASTPTVLTVFLKNGLSVHATNENEESLLMIATKSSQAGVVPLLISNGAKVNDQTKTTKVSALMVAAWSGNKEAVQSLLKAKADFTLLNANGETAKVIAAKNQKSEITALLTQAGATEYAGKELPKNNSFMAELKGKEQTEVSMGVFNALPFIEKNIRFFSTGQIKVSEKDVKPHGHVPAEIIPGFIYAVLPSLQVLKLDSPESMLKLNMKLVLPEHALSLARFFDSPTNMTGLPAVFKRVEFEEFPEASNCLEILPVPTQFGIIQPKVQKTKSGFKVDRFGLLKSNRPVSKVIPSEEARVIRVTETIDFNGRYSLKTEPMKTPGLYTRVTCFGR